MVPASNTGAATPIDMGGGNVGSDLRAKLIHDAQAQVRFLAEGSGRNGTAAAQAVEPKSAACPRCPRSWTAAEAREENVIDLIADDLPAAARRERRARDRAQATCASSSPARRSSGASCRCSCGSSRSCSTPT